MRMINKKEKRGVSPLISTVLLILVSITAAIIIFTVVVPFVRNTLSESKECFGTLDQLTINTESGFTCYYGTGNKIVNITIKRGSKEAEIERFKISISGQGTSNMFDIKDGEIRVKMLDGSTSIEIPEAGGERTYSLNTTMTEVLYAEVYPVMESGKMCDPTDRAQIDNCI